MSSLEQRYVADGIWTMADDRTTCVVPEVPLLINETLEREYNELCIAVWRAAEMLIEYSKTGISDTAVRLRTRSNLYPGGMSMPPAIRIDTVMSENGPKIVEIDPNTAISIGETASLACIWEKEGYYVPTGLIGTIVDRIKNVDGRCNMALNDQPRKYKSELSYLASSLEDAGVSLSDAPGTLRLNPKGGIGSSGWDGSNNPLWGSLNDISQKDNISMLLSMDKIRLPKYLPRTYELDEISALDSDATLIAKPLNSTGSRGITAISPDDASKLSKGYVLQEFVRPTINSFGVESDEGRDEWISRISVYAGRYGLVGAQVTARPYNGGFTNAHGQSDAVQTTLATGIKSND